MQTKSSHEQIQLAHNRYRVAHGKNTLFLYTMGLTSEAFIVKDESLDLVILVGVFSKNEISISPEELSAHYFLFVPDEMVFYMGNPEQIAKATVFNEAVNETVSSLIEIAP